MIVEQPAGNFEDKYNSKNPISARLVANFLRTFETMAERSGVREVYEVGCGEGELIARLAQTGFTVRGSDVAREAIAEALVRHPELEGRIEVAPLQQLSAARDSAPLVVCCEVLEHIDDPEEALDVLVELAKPYLLASVPREPLWRALNMSRLKYVENFGNTPGHVNHWSSRSFVAFLERRFEVIAVSRPLPWTMVLAKSRSAPQASE
ncbi:bifunctional 2-polyprenyl-6-hydroxyphenol methylase/3-demethylubiquinol 3-O-methyltransferase UbiG [Acuticoccus sp. I52.16.1]|uniref:class I SAM-dependent methyltransferase n=1 Tax=Acuticoccus sp. I52.16.1 TaxID=2928472 RepID=UPI001FD4AF45|nr:class I SAM-dependent methyltransferase [Acuticoccus sp. I52.16.1]UOM36768.1 class I SAM-dependent methyltransferase [Acuticoccus sp. I52.16.1]